MDVPSSDTIRTNNSLTLRLMTSDGEQVLPLTGNGAYTFSHEYPNAVSLALDIQKQPDEYFCHRTDAISETTAATTLLSVQCDYMGPEFYHIRWIYSEVRLHGGGIEVQIDDATPILYGLWTAIRISEDERLEVGFSLEGDRNSELDWGHAGWLIVTLPSDVLPGDTLLLQPTAFALGAPIAPNHATVQYTTRDESKKFASGIISVAGYALDVSSRTASLGCRPRMCLQST
jgi:hypothetical protein